MANQRVRVGDAVMLKAGGPVMNVQALSLSLAYCAWPLGGRMHHGTFEVDSLAVVEARPCADGERGGEAGCVPPPSN